MKIELSGLLTTIFILLKVFDKIDWSWWWVLSPLWIPLAIVILVGTLAGLILWLTKNIWR